MSNIILAERRIIERSSLRIDFMRAARMESDAHLAQYLYATSKKDAVQGAKLWEWVLKNVPQYYLKSAEIEILSNPEVLGEISSIVGSGATIAELGPGSTALEKTAPLMHRLENVQGYMGIDISQEYSEGSALEISEEFASIATTGITGNFLDMRLNQYIAAEDKPVVFCVGNTIGNIAEKTGDNEPTNTIAALRKIREIAGDNAYLIISQDTNQNEPSLKDAYFHKGFEQTTLNILERVRSEAGIHVDAKKYGFQVGITRQNGHQKCAINQLVALEPQRIVSPTMEQIHAVKEGDTIDVNRSYKFKCGYFQHMGKKASWEPKAVFTDKNEMMAVHVMKAAKERVH